MLWLEGSIACGNRWASIDVDPTVDMECFFPILLHLAAVYDFFVPQKILAGCGRPQRAEFEILGSAAIIKVDTWTFSIAFPELPQFGMKS